MINKASVKNADYSMNSYTVELVEKFSLVMQFASKSTEFKNVGRKFELLNKKEKYITRLFELQRALDGKCAQLYHIKVYINRYPLKEYYFKRDISQLDYIQYHTEALFHKIHTILEIMKLIVNEVYQLGIPIKDCSWDNIKKRLSVGLLPMKYIDEYFKKFNNLIDLRHWNSHRGYYEDKEKDDIYIYHGLSFHEFKRDGHKFDEEFMNSIPMYIINSHLRQHKKGRVELVDKCISENDRVLKLFLESLLPEFKAQLQKLNNN